MAQLSLYIDDETMTQLREDAAENNLSLSKHVLTVIKGNKINQRSKWPDSFWETFGAITDPTFQAPPADWGQDTARLSFD